LLSPLSDAFPNLIDELVFLDTVFSPFGVEGKLVFRLLLRPCDGDEIRAYASILDDFIRDALVGEAEMAVWFPERRVEYGVFDYDLLHGSA